MTGSPEEALPGPGTPSSNGTVATLTPAPKVAPLSVEVNL